VQLLLIATATVLTTEEILHEQNRHKKCDRKCWRLNRRANHIRRIFCYRLYITCRTSKTAVYKDTLVCRTEQNRLRWASASPSTASSQNLLCVCINLPISKSTPWINCNSLLAGTL
jgi:hypothetical protein